MTKLAQAKVIIIALNEAMYSARSDQYHHADLNIAVFVFLFGHDIDVA